MVLSIVCYTFQSDPQLIPVDLVRIAYNIILFLRASLFTLSVCARACLCLPGLYKTPCNLSLTRLAGFYLNRSDLWACRARRTTSQRTTQSNRYLSFQQFLHFFFFFRIQTQLFLTIILENLKMFRVIFNFLILLWVDIMRELTCLYPYAAYREIVVPEWA